MQRMRMLTLLMIALLGLAAALGACGGASPSTVPGEVTTTLAPATTVAAGTGDWPTYNHDMTRSGISGDQQPVGQVAKAWTSPDLGNYIYAQPLVVGDRVIVATEGGMVFSLDASTGAIAWQVNLGTPVNGKTLPCGNIDPSGITGTPVIDTASGTIYVVAFLSSGPHHELFALDLETGATRWHRTIDPPGLSAKVEQQRGALTVTGGLVYVPFGGLAGDCGQYQGAIVGAPVDGTGDLISYVVPTSRMGGIWNPTGLPVDGAGDLWAVTGNTASLSAFDYGNAVLRLSPELKVLDYFAPVNWVALNKTDQDLSTTVPVLLGGGRVFIAGKNKTGYLLDAANLGQIGTGLATVDIGSPAFGSAVAQGSRVFVPCTSALVAVEVADDQMYIAWTLPDGTGSPIIAAGHVWTLAHDGTLKAVDPVTGAVTYSLRITQPPTQFATLSAANGRLFVADGTAILALSLR